MEDGARRMAHGTGSRGLEAGSREQGPSDMGAWQRSMAWVVMAEEGLAAGGLASSTASGLFTPDHLASTPLHKDEHV